MPDNTQVLWTHDNPTNLSELTLTKGRYILTFDTSLVPDAIIPKDVKKRSLTLAGKKVEVKNYQTVVMDGGIQQVIVEIEVIQNPLPLIAIIAGLGIIASFLLLSVARVGEVIAKNPIIMFLLIGAIFWIVREYVT
jgi:hypothetical protein